MIIRAALAAVLTMGLLAAPLAAGAEQPGKVFRIGILANLRLTGREGAGLWEAFIQGLRELGYVEGQNITIESRVTEGKYERLPDLAADLVGLRVDVLVAPASGRPVQQIEARPPRRTVCYKEPAVIPVEVAGAS